MDLAGIEQSLAELRAVVADQAAEIARLRGQRTRSPEAVAPAPPARRALSRRGLLGAAAGAAAATAVGALAVATPATAANGNSMVLGSYVNLASAPTQLVYNSGNTFAPNYFGFGVVDHAAPDNVFDHTPAIGAYVTHTNFGSGLQIVAAGIADGIIASTQQGNSLYAYSASGYGAYGSSVSGIGVAGFSYETTGVQGEGDPAIEALSSGGTGVRIAAGHAQLFLTGFSADETPNPPPGSGVARFAGEVVFDKNDELWLCVKDGTPGTWRKVAGPATAGALQVLGVPVRVYDSRAGMAPNVGTKSPLVAGTPRTLDLRANSSGVPTGATAALVNVLIVNATAGNGNATVWANGKSQPAANTLVWGGTSGRAAIQTVTAVDGSAKIQVASSIATDVVIDVVGYYR